VDLLVDPDRFVEPDERDVIGEDVVLERGVIAVSCSVSKKLALFQAH
jgi:hypothetical protein